MVRNLFYLFLFAFVAVVAFIAYAGYGFLHPKFSGEAQEIIYEVNPGDYWKNISEKLVDLKMISRPLSFRIYSRITGATPKVGEYLLNTQMRPGEIIAILSSGKSIAKSFTVSEGLNMYEIADLFQAQGFGSKEEFLKLCKNQTLIKHLLGVPLESLEGYLFPETYSLTKYSTAKTLITQMVKRFLQVYDEVNQEVDLAGWSRHQIVILASIIEKETGAPIERPIISSVFHNRLQKKMLLQTDPTVLYGVLDKTGKMKKNITRLDLKTPSRYNTYAKSGLPFGPIANPGREALLAALQPEDSPYLFFVSQNDGTHIFSETYESHNQAVKKYQLDPKARRGKSWRDLNKKNQKN